jgi:stalled ribosome rescue protein Dom34
MKSIAKIFIYFSILPSIKLNKKIKEILINMDGKNTVVIYGAGFIGSDLLRKLAKMNHLITIDNFSKSSLWNIQNIIDINTIEFIQSS